MKLRPAQATSLPLRRKDPRPRQHPGTKTVNKKFGSYVWCPPIGYISRMTMPAETETSMLEPLWVT